jgi:hypothetical protein
MTFDLLRAREGDALTKNEQRWTDRSGWAARRAGKVLMFGLTVKEIYIAETMLEDLKERFIHPSVSKYPSSKVDNKVSLSEFSCGSRIG